MLDHALARAALRTRALTTVVATTGSATLAASAAGYTRTTGSFLTDGFSVGMEVVPTGFTQTTPGIISAITATLLTISGGRTVQTSGSGRTLAVGIPAMRAYQNVPFTPDPQRPYIVEGFEPLPMRVTTIARAHGKLEEIVLSVWNWYGIAGVGTEAIDRGVDAFIAKFTPGTHLSLSNGTALQMAGTVGRSGLRAIDSWIVCTITIQCRASTRNAVAA
jgi:hypothetical protein